MISRTGLHFLPGARKGNFLEKSQPKEGINDGEPEADTETAGRAKEVQAQVHELC